MRITKKGLAEIKFFFSFRLQTLLHRHPVLHAHGGYHDWSEDVKGSASWNTKWILGAQILDHHWRHDRGFLHSWRNLWYDRHKDLLL